LDGYELIRLDQAVWYIRRYCQVLRRREESGDTNVPTLSENLAMLQSADTIRRPARFSLDGLLEKVREDKGNPARILLISQNEYYGRRSIRRIISCWSWPQVNHTPEIFRELDKYVFFSKKTDAHYRTLLKLPPRK